MPRETPLDALARWEDAGAGWRVAGGVPGGPVVVALLTCHGEVADHLRSDDPALLAYVRVRPSSEQEGPAPTPGRAAPPPPGPRAPGG